MIQEGMVKPGTNGKVTAAKVFNIMPSFESIPLKILHVINDDLQAIEEDMPIFDDGADASNVAN